MNIFSYSSIQCRCVSSISSARSLVESQIFSRCWIKTKYFSISISNTISASIVVGFSFSTMVDESQICSQAVLNTKYFEVSALDKDVVLVLAQPIQIGNFKSKYLSLSEG